MMNLLVCCILIAIVVFVIKLLRYQKTEYYQQTQNSYGSVHWNKGRSGEFNTYQHLKSLAGYKRFLFNLYVPKKHGGTTEIDTVLLHESGIYVIESKNYSGWIFGTETQRSWTQTLPTGRGTSQKTRFYNPILQNEGHIKTLRSFVADQTIPFYSYIVFSDSCTLKKITLTSGNHSVVNVRDFFSEIRKNVEQVGRKLYPDKIDALYETLYPLTQVNEAEKILHIKNIQQRAKNHDGAYIPAVSKKLDDGKKQCPYCGGQLVVRTASSGKYQGKRFLGCSNYPRCRYIKNLPEEQK